MTESSPPSHRGPRRPAQRGYAGRSAEQMREARRKRLLDAALTLFATRGYAQSPIESLCSTARVTTRHFYELFGSREALLLALYEDILETLRQAVAASLAPSAASPETRIAGAIDALVHGYLDDPRRARVGVLEVVGVSPAVEARRRQAIHDFAALVRDFCESLAARGEIAPRDYHLISIALVGGINELIAEWLTAARPPERKALVQAIHELLNALLLGGRAGAAAAPLSG